MIFVIAPHARPVYAENLLANFRRQRVSARLIVVENGPAIGQTWPADVVVLRSDSHQADAMNTGLSWLCENGRGSWARFDDDDYYGPDYLARVAVELERHAVVGQTWGFVMFDDGLYRFRGVENDCANCLAGGTLAAITPKVVLFQRQPDDDVRWCRDMRARGARLWATPHRGYCYDRSSSRRGGAPRVITTGPVVTRWGFRGAAEYHGEVLLAYVDCPEPPLRIVEEPSGDEIAAELAASSAC